MNDVSDTITIFNDSSISDSENSKSCEDTPSSNVRGDEAEMCDGQLKGKFVSKNVVNLSKRNLSENEISLLSKGLNFIPACNKVDVARLKLELEQLGRMLRLKWHFRNDKRDIPINPFKTKSTFNHRNKDTAVYLSSLEEKLLKIKVPKDKFNKLTKGEWDAFYNLKIDKSILRYFNFEPSFKLRWCRARNLFGSQIPVSTGRFGLRISCIRSRYLTR